MAKRRAHKLILCNDGGALVGATMEAPIGAQGLVELAIDPLRDTQIDTLYWQLGTDPWLGTATHRLSDQYSHATEVGPRWGQDDIPFSSAGNWRIYENARQMTETGADPATVVIEHGRRAGIEVFLSMRVNDIHDSNLEAGLDDPLMSPMKRAHPDWLLRGEGRASTAYNFALPEVRDYKIALAEEAIDNYDLDGLDWDFCRRPIFFPEGQEAEGSLLLTNTMRRVRDALDRKSKEVGRPLLFSVRVPGSLEQALSVGVDVQSWAARGTDRHPHRRLRVQQAPPARRGIRRSSAGHKRRGDRA